MTTGMRYPADAGGEKNYPPDSEATAFRPVMPMLPRRDPGVLKGAEVHPRDPKTLLGVDPLKKDTQLTLKL